MQKFPALDKVLAPADKAFTSLGRFVLMRPLLSGLVVVSALAITLINNNNASPTPTASTHFTSNDTPSNVAQTTPTEQLTIATLAVISAVTTDSGNKGTDQQWQTAPVLAGDTLSTIFKRQGLSNKDLMNILTLPTTKPLHQLKPGEEIRWLKDTNGQLQQLSYTTRKNGDLTVTRTATGFSTDAKAILPVTAVSTPIAVAPTPAAATASTTTSATVVTPPVASAAKTSAPPKDTNALNYVSGTVKHSLYGDSRKLGLSSKQANQLVQIFSQKRVAQNLRAGDTFNVLYQNPVVTKGKKISGNIMAAQVNRGGKTYSLIRFVDPKGHADYYTPQGQSMRDGLTRKPIAAAKLTSGFSTHRMDPILHEIRPHTGVDYAAPTGTPIKAGGAGVVKEVAYNVGYGNMVVIDHQNNYSTVYAHMSRFASNLKPGTSVQPGQVIGYVGSTGYSTGPHLHYEIRVNDTPANPLTVALPGASIPKVYRSQFLAQSRILLAQLNKKPTLLAQAKPLADHS